MAGIQHQIGGAERKSAKLRNMPIAFDEELRRADPRSVQTGIDDILVNDLRQGMAGKLTDAQLRELVGDRIERYRKQGNTSVKFGTTEWRDLAMSMCFSEYEALERVAERDEGDWTGELKTTFLKDAQVATPEIECVSLRRLFADYIASRKLVGRGMEAEKRWRPVFEDLIRFAKTDDARKLTKAILINLRDQRLTTHAPKTVSTVYLASVRTVLDWAVNNDPLDVNVAQAARSQ